MEEQQVLQAVQGVMGLIQLFKLLQLQLVEVEVNLHLQEIPVVQGVEAILLLVEELEILRQKLHHKVQTVVQVVL